MRAERFELMERLAQLPDDMVFFTQITMEAAEDPAFLDAMRRAHIRGALVGVESVTPEGLKDVYKDFNLSGDDARERLQHVRGARRPRARLVHLRPAERPRRDVRRDGGAGRAGRRDVRAVRDADAVPGHGRLRAVGTRRGAAGRVEVDGVPITRHWLIPQERRPKVYIAAPDDVAGRDPPAHAGASGIGSTRCRRIWARADVVQSLRARLAFVLISKLYRQMYANTGIATDTARTARSAKVARWIARPCRRCSRRRRCPN